MIVVRRTDTEGWDIALQTGDVIQFKLLLYDNTAGSLFKMTDPATITISSVPIPEFNNFIFNSFIIGSSLSFWLLLERNYSYFKNNNFKQSFLRNI